MDILSVGIDIGTSTTETVFSRLSVRNTAGYFSVPNVEITEKRTVFKGKIRNTPMINRTTLDAEAIKEFVASDYKEAGFTRNDLATGAVIITGEAARKENAEAVLEKLSDYAGEFVVSTAGADMESIIAGKGSGAHKYSVDTGKNVLNIDVGGGTANSVLFSAGEVIEKGSLDIGGRQVVTDGEGRATYVSESAAKIARAYGIDLKEGGKVGLDRLTALAKAMADVVFDSVNGVKNTLVNDVTTSGSTPYLGANAFDTVYLSGGVANAAFTEGIEPLQYNDIGVLLGRALKERFKDKLRENNSETIRATVVGAGSYTTSLTGSTIFYSGINLPLKNVPVLKLNANEENALYGGEGKPAKDKLEWFLRATDTQTAIISLKGRKSPTYQEIKQAAYALGEAAKTLKNGALFAVSVESDTAKALGQALFTEIGATRGILSIDSVRLNENDYVDVGKPLMDGLVLPVVVKTLIFGR